MKNRIVATTALLSSLFAATLTGAATAPPDDAEAASDPRGWEIAARSDRSDRGFLDSTVDLEMVLRNKAGKETRRTLTIQTLEIPDESLGDRSLIVFETPADIDGTALLSYAQILAPDDQWLYLPALKRTKRISSVNKSGPFVGSEFAFEDFTSLELGKFSYRYLREESDAAMRYDVLERTPLYEHSGYTRQIAWIDQDVYQVRRVDFFDRRGDLLKTLTLEDYREYEKSVWRPHLMRMVNRKTGKSTDLRYSEYRFRTGIGEQDFSKDVLRRVR